MFATRSWRGLYEPGGSDGIDNAFVRQHDTGIGAEIMGAGKFGCPRMAREPGLEGLVGPLLGRGVRLLDGLEDLEKDYRVEATSSPSGVIHVTFTRAGV